MGLFQSFRRKINLQGAELRRLDELLHEVVHEEMRVNEVRTGLWTKAVSMTEGDETKAKAKYISLRVQSLTDDMLLMEDALAAAREQLDKYRPVKETSPAPVGKSIDTKDPKQSVDPPTQREPLDWTNFFLVLIPTAIILILLFILFIKFGRFD